jgi:transcriptional regulator with XRE-family HTH domain
MLRSNLPRAVRFLRRRRRWRQADLGARAATSDATVSRLERGLVRGLTLGTVERIAAALDASVDVTLRWEGERLDRLIDAAHAHLAQQTVALLGSLGWLVRPEVSFNHYGDRGVVDILAFHPVHRVLLVVEIKSFLGDLQAALGRLDVKARLGRSLAESVGWGPVVAVIPALVLADTRTNRRTIGTHGALFIRYPVRGRSALAWLRRPVSPAPSGVLWFSNLPDSRGLSVMRGRRVRTVTNDR